jgi:hypothetical protein
MTKLDVLEVLDILIKCISDNIESNGRIYYTKFIDDIDDDGEPSYGLCGLTMTLCQFKIININKYNNFNIVEVLDKYRPIERKNSMYWFISRDFKIRLAFLKYVKEMILLNKIEPFNMELYYKTAK